MGGIKSVLSAMCVVGNIPVQGSFRLPLSQACALS